MKNFSLLGLSLALNCALWAAAGGYAAVGKLDEARQLIPRILHLHPAMRVSNLKDYIPTRRPKDLETATKNLRLAGLPE